MASIMKKPDRLISARKFADENAPAAMGKLVRIPPRQKTMDGTETSRMKRAFEQQTDALKSTMNSKRMRSTDRPRPLEVRPTVGNKVDVGKKVGLVKPTTLQRQKPVSAANKPAPVATRSMIPAPSAGRKAADGNVTLTDMGKAIDVLNGMLPEGVHDIDKNDTDSLHCAVYARDIIHYGKSLEKTWRHSTTFVKKFPIKPNTRAILTDWIIQVQNHLDMDQQTLHLAVAMIDHSLAKFSVPLGTVQLLGITCLFIAAKFEERFPPTVDKLLHLTDNSYEYEEVILMELQVLKALSFTLNMPTPIFFLDRALKVVREHASEPITSQKKFQHLSGYLLDLTLPNLRMLQYEASLKAAAAAYLAARLLYGVDADTDDRDTLVLRALSHHLVIPALDIKRCAKQLDKMLENANTDKLQGAREKYSSRAFSSVSKLPGLQGTSLTEVTGAK